VARVLQVDRALPERGTEDRSAAPRILYLDQNAWIVLARGAWDKSAYPAEHAALSTVIGVVRTGAAIVPLSFTNLYETMKINDPARRAAMAHTQAVISGGRVFRGRRRIFGDTLAAYLATRFGFREPPRAELWFLSDLFFEAAADHSPELFGFEISQRVVEFIRRRPAEALFDYLALSDEEVRLEAVRRYSASSTDLIAAIEARRALVAGESFAMRRRVYGARLIIDEIEFILAAGRKLGLAWKDVRDVGGSLLRALTVDVPILRAERELVIRLEDQARAVTENDLRDMSAFTAVLPLADVVVAEKPFVNLAKQARLGELYGTSMLTSIFELESAMLT
jgi:hypothetical protein